MATISKSKQLPANIENDEIQSFNIRANLTIRVGDFVYLNSLQYTDFYQVARVIRFPYSKTKRQQYIEISHYYRKSGTGTKWSPTDDPKLLYATTSCEEVHYSHIISKCTVTHISNISDLDAYRKLEDHFYFSHFYDIYVGNVYELVPTTLITNIPEYARVKLIEMFSFIYSEKAELKKLMEPRHDCIVCDEWADFETSIRCMLCNNYYHGPCCNPPVHKKFSKGIEFQCSSCLSKAQVDFNDPTQTIPKGFEVADQSSSTSIVKTVKGSLANPNEIFTKVELKCTQGFPFRYVGKNLDPEDLIDDHADIHTHIPATIGKEYQLKVPEYLGPYDPKVHDDEASKEGIDQDIEGQIHSYILPQTHPKPHIYVTEEERQRLIQLYPKIVNYGKALKEFQAEMDRGNAKSEDWKLGDWPVKDRQEFSDARFHSWLAEQPEEVKQEPKRYISQRHYTLLFPVYLTLREEVALLKKERRALAYQEYSRLLDGRTAQWIKDPDNSDFNNLESRRVRPKCERLSDIDLAQLRHIKEEIRNRELYPNDPNYAPLAELTKTYSLSVPLESIRSVLGAEVELVPPPPEEEDPESDDDEVIDINFKSLEDYKKEKEEELDMLKWGPCKQLDEPLYNGPRDDKCIFRADTRRQRIIATAIGHMLSSMNFSIPTISLEFGETSQRLMLEYQFNFNKISETLKSYTDDDFNYRLDKVSFNRFEDVLNDLFPELDQFLEQLPEFRREDVTRKLLSWKVHCYRNHSKSSSNKNKHTKKVLHILYPDNPDYFDYDLDDILEDKNGKGRKRRNTSQVVKECVNCKFTDKDMGDFKRIPCYITNKPYEISFYCAPCADFLYRYSVPKGAFESILKKRTKMTKKDKFKEKIVKKKGSKLETKSKVNKGKGQIRVKSAKTSISDLNGKSIKSSISDTMKSEESSQSSRAIFIQPATSREESVEVEKPVEESKSLLKAGKELRGRMVSIPSNTESIKVSSPASSHLLATEIASQPSYMALEKLENKSNIQPECMVCQSYLSTKYPLTTCQCGLSVHPACYLDSIHPFSKSFRKQPWMCDWCHNQNMDQREFSGSNICQICLQADTPPYTLRPTEGGHWVHSFCLGFTGGIGIHPTRHVWGLAKQLKEARENNSRCKVCQNEGIVLKCHFCDYQCHSRCAFGAKAWLGYQWADGIKLESSISTNLKPVMVCRNHLNLKTDTMSDYDQKLSFHGPSKTYMAHYLNGLACKKPEVSSLVATYGYLRDNILEKVSEYPYNYSTDTGPCLKCNVTESPFWWLVIKKDFKKDEANKEDFIPYTQYQMHYGMYCMTCYQKIGTVNNELFSDPFESIQNEGIMVRMDVKQKLRKTKRLKWNEVQTPTKIEKKLDTEEAANSKNYKVQIFQQSNEMIVPVQYDVNFAENNFIQSTENVTPVWTENGGDYRRKLETVQETVLYQSSEAYPNDDRVPRRAK